MGFKEYSFKKNLRYLRYCFHKPRLLIREAISESNLFSYIILPFILFTLGYEILYIRGFILNEPLLPLPKIFPLSDSQYRLLEIFIFPLVHLSCFTISMLIILVFSKIYESDRIDAVKITYFFVLVGNTVGLIALIIDIIGIIIPWEYWIFIHPISAIIYGIYLVYFIQEVSGIKKVKACLITIFSLIAFFSFRMLFIR
ncbi:MAG: hypothetical protein ACFE9I_13925 [Candidatus Hermodarchaeota archaeon]